MLNSKETRAANFTKPVISFKISNPKNISSIKKLNFNKNQEKLRGKKREKSENMRKNEEK